jgi:hypothetical protein
MEEAFIISLGFGEEAFLNKESESTDQVRGSLQLLSLDAGLEVFFRTVFSLFQLLFAKVLFTLVRCL